MKAREILCLAVLPDEIRRASKAIAVDAVLPETSQLDEHIHLLENNLCRECVFIVLHRFLRTHGLPHSNFHHRRQNLICIDNCRIQPIFYTIESATVTTEQILQTPVFLPDGFHLDDPGCDRLLYIFINEPFRLVLRAQLKNLYCSDFSNCAFEPVICHHKFFIAAAPDIAECRKLFRAISKGAKCLQYPAGLLHPAMGALVTELTSFPQIFDWHGV